MKSVTTSCIIIVVLLIVVLPVSSQDSSRSVIMPDNAAQLTELIRLGRGSTEHVAYSPDGQTLAVASTVGVWLYQPSALDTPDEPALLPTPKVAEAIAYSPDGSTLAVVSDSTVFYWNTATQEMTGSFELSRSSESIAYSPDGTLLAINMGYSGISLWDIAAGVEKAKITGSVQGDAALVFSPDGTLLAYATGDYAIHLVKVADATEAALLTGHTRYVYDFVFSGDGTVLASASYDKSVRLWNAATGENLAVLAGTDAQPIEEAYALAVSPDGELLVSGHADGVAVVWDVDSLAPAFVFGPQTGDIVDVTFSPDGKQIATASSLNVVQTWDAAAGAAALATVGHTNYISAAAFSPDSATLAIADWDKNIWLWDTAARQQLNFTTPVPAGQATSSENLTWVAYSSDGRLLAVSDGFDAILHDAASGEQIRKLSGCVGSTVSFAFSPDNTLLAEASSDGLCVFAVETGELLASFSSGDWLNGVTFSPDQTMIATASKDHTARVYGLP
ncbi:MAG: WD40 repeat domain-containing protein [Anaerolineae bacterium]|nr:WD40 repeat domain-containing protein [Anaerolineae bacterium]